METTDPRTARELAMFGMTTAQLRQVYESALGHKMMFVMGLASDAQEEIERGMTERARKTLNCMKYLLSTYHMTDLEVAA